MECFPASERLFRSVFFFCGKEKTGVWLVNSVLSIYLFGCLEAKSNIVVFSQWLLAAREGFLAIEKDTKLLLKCTLILQIPGIDRKIVKVLRDQGKSEVMF